MTTITDARQRPLRDLRISVTDRCNFRCTYCMPKEVFGRDYVFLPQSEVLTFEEITRLARTFVDHGVEKIRLTGGEPLVRRDIVKLVGMLSQVPGLRDLTMTTNGSLLTPEMARNLKAAGLRRITISLDSLRDDVFTAMNDVGVPVSVVLAAIDNAAAAGLEPVKIDMVVQRGVNEDSILEMAGHFRGSGHILRFIEYMDVGTTNGWPRDHRDNRRFLADRASRGELLRRSRRALALQGRRRRDRSDLVRHATVLRQLHETPSLRRRPSLHLPVRRLRPRLPQPLARRQDG
jgi:cyclic pyranopterin phosphate synthase